MTIERYALDTNVLLSLSHRRHAKHDEVAAAILRLAHFDAELFFAAQNIGEFWNVSTRPLDRNGFGQSIQATEAHVSSMERRMTLLPEDGRVYRVWRRLLLDHEVRGVQVHDAHLAAVLEVHRVSHLLTYNATDFKRFSNIVAVHPQDVR